MGMTLGDRLRWAREAAAISARKLDELAGLTPGHTNGIESGRRPNTESRTAIAISDVLGISLDWLLKGDGDQPDAEVVRSTVAARLEKHCA